MIILLDSEEAKRDIDTPITVDMIAQEAIRLCREQIKLMSMTKL